MPIDRPPPGGEERPDDPLAPWLEGVLDAAGLPSWEDESAAPPLDRDALRRYAAGEALGDDAARRLDDLVHRFRSWHEAYLRELAARVRRGEGDGPPEGVEGGQG